MIFALISIPILLHNKKIMNLSRTQLGLNHLTFVHIQLGHKYFGSVNISVIWTNDL